MTGQSIGSVFLNLKLNDKKYKAGLAGANKQAAGLGKTFTKLGAVIAGAFAVKKIYDFAKASIMLASDLEEVQNVVDTTFGEGAKQINEFAKTASNKFGISELKTKKFTGTMGAMIKSMGFAENETLEMSTMLTGLTGDMASFYNLDHETTFQKIRSGISGETEPLKQLGINLSVANLETFALTQGIKKQYREMNEAEKATLRYNYILEATSDAQGDFSKTSDSTANQLRIMQLNFEKLKTKVGKALLPIFNKLLKFINNKLIPKLEDLGKFFKKIKNFFGNLVSEFKKGNPFIRGLAIFIGTLVGVLVAFNIVAGIAAGVSAALGVAIGILTSPVFLVAAAIAAVITAGYLLIKNWDEIKKSIGNFISNVWNKIKKFFSNVWSGIIEFLKELPQKIGFALGYLLGMYIKFHVKVYKAIWDFIKKLPEIIFAIVKWFAKLPGKIWNVLKKAIKGLGKFFWNMNYTIAQKMPEIISGIVDFFKELPGKIFNIGKNVATSFKDGVKSMWTKTKKAVGGFFQGIVDGVKKGLGINSPSKVFMEIGNNVSAGLGEGITTGMKYVDNAINKLNTRILPDINYSGDDKNISKKLQNMESKVDGKNIGNNGSQLLNNPSDDRPLNLTLKVNERILGEVSADSINRLSEERGEVVIKV